MKIVPAFLVPNIKLAIFTVLRYPVLETKKEKKKLTKLYEKPRKFKIKK